MTKKGVMCISSLFLGIFLFQLSGCSKQEENDQNPTNGKTTAEFNPGKTYGSMTDQDGNIYKNITIGTETWMAENLRTTKYNDGTPIPNIIEGNQWDYLTTGAYCNYNNTANLDTIATYGCLYNWYAVNTGKLCPSGWHVPDDEEWIALTNYLGGTNIAGGKLKESGTTHWTSPNVEATNETGFTALPGGDRISDGNFSDIGDIGYWWSTSETNENYTWSIVILNNLGEVFMFEGLKKMGFSVRCKKD